MTKTDKTGDTHLTPSDGKSIENTLNTGTMSPAIFKLMGSIGAFDLSRKFNNVMRLVNLQEVRTLYKSKNKYVIAIAPTFKGFCEVVGVNYSSIKEHLNNLHTFGQEFLEQAERMALPIRDLRNIKKLPEDARKIAIDTILHSDTVDPDAVKTVIRDLVTENTRMKDLQNEANLHEKVELVESLELETKEKELAKSYLTDTQFQLKSMKAKVKELMDSQKPSNRIRAMQEISTQLENFVDVLQSVSGDVDDPILIAEKERLQSLIKTASDILK